MAKADQIDRRGSPRTAVTQPAVAGHEPPYAGANPFSLCIGTWLGITRRRRRLATAEVAAAFDRNDSYWRSIEAGSTPLPADTAGPLVRVFGLGFEQAAVLLALVRQFEKRGEPVTGTSRRGAKQGEFRPYDLAGITA